MSSLDTCKTCDESLVTQKEDEVHLSIILKRIKANKA